jgi:hypothetical protein
LSNGKKKLHQTTLPTPPPHSQKKLSTDSILFVVKSWYPFHLTPVDRDEPCLKKFELKSNLDPISKQWRKGNFTIYRELKMRGRWWFVAKFF